MGIFRDKNRVLSRKKKGKQAKVISFLNQKGGVGKTTMAFNVTCALAERGHRVLGIDMDPQSNLSMLFEDGVRIDEDKKPTIFQHLVNSIKELKPLHTKIKLEDSITTRHGVDFIASGDELSGFDLTIAGISIPRQLVLKNFIEKSGLASKYDYIVIDCPPTLGLLVVNSLCASHGIMVPFKPDDFSRKGLEQVDSVLENIHEMGIGNSPEVIAYIPNLVDNRRKQEAIDLEEICQRYNEETLGCEIPPFYNRSTIVKAQAQKKSVFNFKSKDFLELQVQFDSLAKKIEEFRA